MTPRVSVLMPVFNVAPYLKEAMDSILSQTYEDFELIVLNDCSPDDSEAILDMYADPRIVRYHGETNVGLANVLNVGIRMAKGEYIARMDSDDISLPTRLEAQVSYLDSHPEVDLVSAGMRKFGASEDILVHRTDLEEVKFEAMTFSPILHASSMWRKARFMAENLYYKQEMVPSEDYDLWTRALVKGLVLINIPDILYKYRSHESQVTFTNKNWDKNSDIAFWYIESIFPGISKDAAQRFRLLIWNENPKEIKSVSQEIEKENSKVLFFNPISLHNRLKRNYQTRLYNQMLSNGIDIGVLFDLRLKQIIKLVINRVHDKCSHTSL